MLLGKRPRPPMKRTTSMTEITLDLNKSTEVEPLNCQRSGGGGFNGLDQSQSNKVLQQQQQQAAPPRNQRRHSLDFVETPDFLRACSLCRRRLVPGRDIYMYRGDSAFCSHECRQKQMNQDERKEKVFVASKKQVVAAPSSGSQVTTATTKGETTVAAL